MVTVTSLQQSTVLNSSHMMLKAVKSNDSNEVEASCSRVLASEEIFLPMGDQTWAIELLDALMKLIGVQGHVPLAYRPESEGTYVWIGQ